MIDSRFKPTLARVRALKRLVLRVRDVGLPAADDSPLSRYLREGDRRGSRPHWLFDPVWYRAQATLLRAQDNALLHYLRVGEAAGLTPHPLFDPAWYRTQVVTLRAGETALSHYLREGEALGFSPHPLFDPSWYRVQAPALAPHESALAHYIRSGDAAGLSPHPLFDVAWYRSHAVQLAPEDTALAHYLREGDAANLSPHPLFDPARYRWQQAGLRLTDNALLHLLRNGFDVAAYVEHVRQHPELEALRTNPLVRALARPRPIVVDVTTAPAIEPPLVDVPSPASSSEPLRRALANGNRLLQTLDGQGRRHQAVANVPQHATVSARRAASGSVRTIVFTCCYGNYEALKEPTVLDPSVRFIAFTDNPALTSKSWEVCVLNDHLGDARRSSRLPKVLPHLYLPDHDVSIYIDASLQWRAPDVGKMVAECLEGRDIGVYRHKRRDCVFDEIDTCAALGIEHPEVLDFYRSHYEELGMSRNAGLYENGLIVRRNTTAMRTLNEAWWRVYLGQRDQLALVSALHTTGVQVNAIKYGKQVRVNDYVAFQKHERPALPVRKPKLYVFVAYAPPGYAQDLGRTYNDYMELIDDDAYALFLDHDAMFCSPNWFQLIQQLMVGYDGVECLVVGRTNRIGNPYQRVGVLSHEHRASVHAQLAEYLNETQRDWVANVSRLDSTSGVILMLSKRTWKQVRFSSGFLKVDNRMHIAFRDSGRPVFMPASLYAYHFYRADGDQSHAVLLDGGAAPTGAASSVLPPAVEAPHDLKTFVIDEAAGLDLAHYAPLLRAGEWAVFLRADAMFCDKAWYPRVYSKLDTLAAHTLLLFGNNLFDSASPSSDDILEHRAYAATRLASPALLAQDPRHVSVDHLVAFVMSKATLDAFVGAGEKGLADLASWCERGTCSPVLDSSTHVFCRSIAISPRQAAYMVPSPKMNFAAALSGHRRVAILTLGFWPSQAGMELMIHNLAVHLTEAGDLVTLYAPRPDKPFDEIPHNYLLKRFKSERHFLEIFRRQHSVMPFDVLLVQGGLEAASMALILKEELGVPVVLRTHGEDIQIDDTTGYGYRRDANKRAVIDSNIRRVDRNIVIGEHIAPLVQEIAPDTTVTTIHNGVDTQRFRPQASRHLHDKLGLAPDRLVLLTVGRNVKKKAFHLAIHALKLVLERVPQAVLVHAGRDGNGENLHEVAETLGVAGSFHRLGEVNYFETPLLYASADLFVFPSKVETFGNVTVEALSAGLPCVEFDYLVNRQKIESGRNGYVVPFGDVEQFAERIVELLIDPDKRRSFSLEARAKAINTFAWERVADNYRQVFREFRSDGARRPGPASGYGLLPFANGGYASGGDGS